MDETRTVPDEAWIEEQAASSLDRLLPRIEAPATALLSEAIVHPDEVRKYVAADECPLSYNPQLMALLWEAPATRDVRVLHESMEGRFELPGDCAWVNYVRCHDDIGWAFSDDEVVAAGFDPKEHRRFLTRFYTGRHEGGFARGQPFQEEPETGDARVSGTFASLAGVEAAIEDGDDAALDLAIRRMLLLYGVIVTIGGIPLIYLGDEVATLNDDSYDADPEKAGDSRWLHRVRFDREHARKRRDVDSVPGRVFNGLLRLLRIRAQNPHSSSRTRSSSRPAIRTCSRTSGAARTGRRSCSRTSRTPGSASRRGGCARWGCGRR